jgi:hypothetical protein
MSAKKKAERAKPSRSDAPICSAVALAARQSPTCACGRPKDHGPEDTGCIVCWHCFKHRGDGLRFKDFPGSYEDWIKLLPNVEAIRPATKTTNETNQ